MKRVNQKRLLEMKIEAAKAVGGTNLYVFTKEELDAHDDELRYKAVLEASVVSLAIPLLAAKNAGWDRESILAFADAITDEYEAYSKGVMTIPEYKRFIYKETGIKFAEDLEG